MYAVFSFFQKNNNYSKFICNLCFLNMKNQILNIIPVIIIVIISQRLGMVY